MPDQPFRIQHAVTEDEIDQLGHVNHAVYHKYGERARLAFFTAAGCALPQLVADGIGIVLLESHIRYTAELRLGDDITVTCETRFGTGKTFQMEHSIVRGDGTLAADIRCTVGLLDLEVRRLLPEPWHRLNALASHPQLLDGRGLFEPGTTCHG